MLERSKKTNLLEQRSYKYELHDVEKPNLYSEIYDYAEVPKVPFNHRRVPLGMADEIWITDTSFRDGQQSREPYTVEEISSLFRLLSRLGGEKGIIRQTEFFAYSKKDREAIEKCQSMGLKFPEITTWIRAKKEDFGLVKSLGIRETGILVSASDYHIFKKMGLTRKQALDKYLGIVKDAFDVGIVPRCHLEDITRADFYGFVVPFVNELERVSEEAGIPVKVRACDTMGYGVPFAEVGAPQKRRGDYIWPSALFGHYLRPSGVARPQRFSQGRGQRHHRLALRRKRGQLFHARHRGKDGERAFGGHGAGIRFPARFAGRHGYDGDYGDRGLLPRRYRLRYSAHDALCGQSVQYDAGGNPCPTD